MDNDVKFTTIRSLMTVRLTFLSYIPVVVVFFSLVSLTNLSGLDGAGICFILLER